MKTYMDRMTVRMTCAIEFVRSLEDKKQPPICIYIVMIGLDRNIEAHNNITYKIKV